VLYGSSYCNEIINFDALVRHGMINREDLALFQFADDPATAFGLLQAGIVAELEETTPSIAHSRTPHRWGDRTSAIWKRLAMAGCGRSEGTHV